MAPLLKIIVQWFPSLPRTLITSSHAPSSIIVSPTSEEVTRLQQPIGFVPAQHIGSHAPTSGPSLLSSVSRGKNSIDIFGLAGNNLTHKFWDGSQWNPAGSKLETLGNGLATPPSAVSWDVNRLDVFGLDDHNVIKHQRWDGTDWRPNVAELENLGGPCAEGSSIAVSTSAPGRLDLFCRGPEGGLLHQFYDGYQWQPSAGSLESLGGVLVNSPTAVSWSENRLDVFALNEDYDVQHLYWDGSQWSKWETFKNSVSFRNDALTVRSWGEQRLDIFATAEDDCLWHKYYDGSQWADWEKLGSADTPLLRNVEVTSWSTNRFDIVGLDRSNGHYLYKFYDGESWQPSTLEWYDKGPQRFRSNPSIVSWGENRLDIFGESVDGKLLHQAWTGYDWYPGSTDWECLAGCEVGDFLPVREPPFETELR